MRAPIMEDNFRRQCESALIHPVTVAALVVLLVNDVVLKSIWPDAWGTGKLSDLAWVVFASPLLAFLLSFVVGRRTAWQRAAFLTSYAGLPLLYAAFNTFEPVHGWILQGISFLSGGTAGSPLDATDSLVIPLGLGIALWVWRSGAASREALRLRWGLLMAAVAALASVATSYPPPEIGITRVGVSEDGAVYAEAEGDYSGNGRIFFLSRDGGFSWTQGPVNEDDVQWGGTSVETPRGRYSIQGSDIVRSGPEGPVVPYSAAYLQEESNVWVQERATADLDQREIATSPLAVAYDDRSGNLIVAMGIQGVVVGTADGQWSRHAVGRYSPTEFTFSGKTKVLLSNDNFWVAALALSLSMVGLALLASRYRTWDIPLLAAVTALVLSLLVALPALLVVTGNERVLNVVLLGTFTPLAGILAVIALGISLGFMPKESLARKGLGLALGIAALLATGVPLYIFASSGASDFTYSVFLLLAIPAFALGIATVAASWRELRHWPAVVIALAGMNALTVLAFMLWLHLGVALILAKVSAIILAALVGLVLAAYIKSRPRAEDPTPVRQGGPTPRC